MREKEIRSRMRAAGRASKSEAWEVFDAKKCQFTYGRLTAYLEKLCNLHTKGTAKPKHRLRAQQNGVSDPMTSISRAMARCRAVSELIHSHSNETGRSGIPP